MKTHRPAMKVGALQKERGKSRTEMSLLRWTLLRTGFASRVSQSWDNVKTAHCVSGGEEKSDRSLSVFSKKGVLVKGYLSRLGFLAGACGLLVATLSIAASKAIGDV